MSKNTRIPIYITVILCREPHISVFGQSDSSSRYRFRDNCIKMVNVNDRILGGTVSKKGT